MSRPTLPRRAPADGFTLIEAIIAIVVLSFALAGLMLALNTATRSSADPLITRQMTAIAQTMLEEVMLKLRDSPDVVNRVGCDRSNYVKVEDYDNYDSAKISPGICRLNGDKVPGLGAYDVLVQLPQHNLAGVSGKRVIITVRHGSDRVEVQSWVRDVP